MNFKIFVMLSLTCNLWASNIIDTEDKFNWYADYIYLKIHIDNCLKKRSSILNHDKYKDSVYKVIPKMFADCKNKKNEFNTTEDIIEYQGTIPTNYTRANKNAVLLANLFHMFLNEEYSNIELDEACIDTIAHKLLKYYKIDFTDSAYDIKQYFKIFDLYSFIKGENDIFTTVEPFTGKNKAASFIVNYSDMNHILFTIHKGTVSTYYRDVYYRKFQLDDYMTTPEKLKFPNLEKLKLQWSFKPLEFDEINVLPNFKFELNSNKCWFNSVMHNLYNSSLIRTIIDEMNKKVHIKEGEQNFYISKWIKKIFECIKNGHNEKYSEILKGFAHSIKNYDYKYYIDFINNKYNEDDPFLELIIKILINEAELLGIDISEYFSLSYHRGRFCDKGHMICLFVDDVYNALSEFNSLYLSTPMLCPQNSEERFKIIKSLTYCDRCEKNTEYKEKYIYTKLPHIVFIPVKSCTDKIKIETSSGYKEYRLIGISRNAEGISNDFEAVLKLKNNKWCMLNDLKDPNKQQLTEFNRNGAGVAIYEIVQ